MHAVYVCLADSRCWPFQEVKDAEDRANSPEKLATSLFPLGPASVLYAIFYQMGHKIYRSVLPHICALYGQRKATFLSLSLISRLLGAIVDHTYYSRSDLKRDDNNPKIHCRYAEHDKKLVLSIVCCPYFP